MKQLNNDTKKKMQKRQTTNQQMGTSGSSNIRHSIVIFDGQLNETTPEFDHHLTDMQNRLEIAGYSVKCFKLRNMTLQPCTGCFSCWVKTPGLCKMKDDGDILRAAWLNSDLVVFASPLMAGFASSLLKTLVDKFIPLALPYINLVHGEMRHYLRYEFLSPLACLFSPGPDDDTEDLQVNYDWVERVAYHTNEPLVFSATPDDDLDTLVQTVASHFAAVQQPIKPLPWLEPLPHPELPAREGSHRLLILNGSLRIKSNTGIIMEHLRAGFESIPGNNVTTLSLNNRRNREKAREAWDEADLVLFAMPLYVHAMPGHLKSFIEELNQAHKRQGRRVAFLVQSGFAESHQSRWLERYFARLPARWGAEYLGTVVRGNVEGIQVQPEVMTRKLFESMKNLGFELGRSALLPSELVRSIGEREHLSASYRFVFRVMKVIGLADWYWNKQLKDNGAFDQRFARPLE